MSAIHLSHRLYWGLFVFVLSITLRIIYPSVIEYKFDQIQAIEISNTFLAHPHFLAKGPPSSWGFPYFPMFYYVIAILQYILSNPLWVSWAIAIINGIVVGIFFLLFSEQLGIPTALLASVLWATSPWMIRYSRIIWAPSIQLFFLPIIYSICIQDTKKATAPKALLFGLSFALFIQIYPSGLLFVPLLLYRLYKKSFGLWFWLAFVIAFVPSFFYIYHEFSQQTFCPSCTQIVQTLSHNNTIQFEHWIRPFQLPGALGFQEVIGKTYNLMLQKSFSFLLLPILWISSGCVVGLGIYLMIRQKRHLFLSRMFIYIVLVYFLSGTGNYMHYHLILAPVVFIAFAYCIMHINTVLPKSLKHIPYIYTALLVIGNMVFNFSLFQTLKGQVYIAGDFGETYESKYARAKPFLDTYKTSPYYPEIQTIVFMGDTDTTIKFLLIPFFIQRHNVSEANQIIKDVEEVPTLDSHHHELLKFYKKKLSENYLN